jgi:hypothetical protein
MRNRWFTGSVAGVLLLAFSGLALAQSGGRVSATQKGSLLIWSKVELRWGANGALTQDTVVEMTNDYPDDVCVQLYFILGDEPLDPVFAGDPPMLVAEGEPGWIWADCQICLTQDQPTYWSAATGLPAGCQPFVALDPSTGQGPGRPDPDRPGSRILRGLIYGWAVDNAGHAINWNHLSGGATLINYLNSDAWEYNAWAFQALNTSHGSRTGEPGRIRLDGGSYDRAFGALLMDFFASGSQALSSGANIVTSDTDLTLHPVTADLRQDSFGPVTTKAEFAIWNENERRFSGTTRCITCWDQTLLSQYGTPNHFLLNNLQTDKGKARIVGVESIVCDLNCIRDGDMKELDIDQILDILGIDHVCSYDAAILGVVAKVLAFSGASTGEAHAGRNLVGMNGSDLKDDAFIKWDIIAPPGTLEDGSAGLRNDRNIGKATSRTDVAAPVAPAEIPGN